MTVTGDTPAANPARTVGIGELSRLTGVPVRTIRFYSDEGLVQPLRSAGGHRRFPPSAVDRLRLVRQLRGLGLGLRSITDVLDGTRSVADVVAAERSALDVELAALAWRRASLRAVEQAPPADRAARLELLAAVQDGSAAADVLQSFWRGFFLGPLLPADTVAMFLSVSVPALPPVPTPDQVVAYAEMVTLIEDSALRRRMRERARANLARIADEDALHTGIGEACTLAEPLVLAGRAPGPGRALDHFVSAHATACGTRDSPGFRRDLLRHTAVDRDPRLLRYWRLVGTVTGEPLTVGETHSWLLDALAASAR